MTGRFSVLLCWMVACAAVAAPVPAPAQDLAGGAVQAARNEVVAALVASLPAELPDGALAILPPEVAESSAVDPTVVTSWPAVVAEATHAQRPGVALTDRASLTAILREQRFGDSAYADPDTAVEVGRLLAAKVLFLTDIHEFQLRSGRVRVNLEASLVDVETGEILWTRAVSKGIFPLWAKVLIGLALLVVAGLVVSTWNRRRQHELVEATIPQAKAVVRVDVDGLATSVVEARERLQAAGETEAAAALQKAWVDLDATLDRVRHALPGGAVDENRIRDLKAAVREAGRLAGTVDALRRTCDQTGATASAGQALVEQVSSATAAIRASVDAYRRAMV